ncbi:MAG: hypothetical protein WC718_07870, partial [Phycisphaerales bacterium]
MSMNSRGSSRGVQRGLAIGGALVATAAALLPAFALRSAMGLNLVTIPMMLLAVGVLVAIAAEAWVATAAASPHPTPQDGSPAGAGPQLATSFLLWATLVASFASSSHTGPGVQRAATAIGVTAVL